MSCKKLSSVRRCESGSAFALNLPSSHRSRMGVTVLLAGPSRLPAPSPPRHRCRTSATPAPRARTTAASASTSPSAARRAETLPLSMPPRDFHFSQRATISLLRCESDGVLANAGESNLAPQVVEEHLEACLKAGLNVGGINCEVRARATCRAQCSTRAAHVRLSLRSLSTTEYP